MQRRRRWVLGAALAQARADLEIARAELGLAQENFARRKQLFGSNVISEEVQDQTELDLAVARSKLVQATSALERARSRTGRTDQRVVEVLEGLSEGEILGIPMLSRLKEEHDLLDARVRRSRSFRGNPAKNRKPAGGHP